MFFAFHATAHVSTRSRRCGRVEWMASRNATFKTDDVKLLYEQKFGDLGEI
jgi:hypothetical protein